MKSPRQTSKRTGEAFRDPDERCGRLTGEHAVGVAIRATPIFLNRSDQMVR